MKTFNLDQFGQKLDSTNVLDTQKAQNIQGGRAVDLIVVWLDPPGEEEGLPDNG